MVLPLWIRQLNSQSSHFNSPNLLQDPGSDGGEGDGQAIVVGVAAHYKKNVASQEELLLHIVKVGFGYESRD